MSTRIPPLLEPYLALPPEASLILLTSVLGASSNWLVLRFLHSALLSSPATSDTRNAEEWRILLVSFMRDLPFWKENARKLGLDLDKYTAKRRFAFADGLSGLFSPKQQKPVAQRAGHAVLRSSDLSIVSQDLSNAISQLDGGQKQGGSKVALVVDQLDLLLAAGGEQVSAGKLMEMLMGLREQVHATIITLSADYPLISAQQTPLETDHAQFLLSLAHESDLMMSLRLLDTGTARDVSGVIRIAVGGLGEDESREAQNQAEEKELLYFVGGDGGVKVFERGQ